MNRGFLELVEQREAVLQQEKEILRLTLLETVLMAKTFGAMKDVTPEHRTMFLEALSNVEREVGGAQ